MNIATQKYNITSLAEAKKGQHREGILLTADIAAGQTLTTKVEIGTAGTILSLRIAGLFTTLDAITVGGARKVVDDGICHLRGQLIDTDQNLSLYNDFVPLSLLLSPGRVKINKEPTSGAAVENYLTAYIVGGVTQADAAAPSGFLYEMQEFTHPYNPNSYIRMDVKNDAQAVNRFAIYFDSLRVNRRNPEPPKINR